MAKFISVPTEITAEQFLEGEAIPKGVCVGWKCNNRYASGDVNRQPHVHTIHDNQRVYLEFGDWIVPEPDGVHYYPIKPGVLATKYRPLCEEGKEK